jgi:hypothetical protein
MYGSLDEPLWSANAERNSALTPSGTTSEISNITAPLSESAQVRDHRVADEVGVDEADAVR